MDALRSLHIGKEEEEKREERKRELMAVVEKRRERERERKREGASSRKKRQRTGPVGHHPLPIYLIYGGDVFQRTRREPIGSLR
jgi:hypothetical protein